MTVLIVYETIEGQTGKIVNFIENFLKGAGHDCRTFDTSERTEGVSYSDVDRVILAAPVHERRHPKEFEVFLAADGEQLSNKKSLMLSVSLKAAFADGLEAARDFVQEMEMRTKFTATHTVLVAGAVRPSSYDYYETQVLRHVILAGQDIEPDVRDREFTDWPALKAELERFLKDETGN